MRIQKTIRLGDVMINGIFMAPIACGPCHGTPCSSKQFMKTSSDDYYECVRCGHVWHGSSNDPVAIEVETESKLIALKKMIAEIK